MADLKFGNRTYRKMGDTWMVQPATLPGFIAVTEESAIAMLDEIERLREEVRKVRLDHITTLGELQVADEAITRLNAENDALRAAGDALAEALAWWSKAADEIERLRAEASEDEQVRERMTNILHRTANALHGGPLTNGLHSWSDLPKLAERLRAAGDGLEEALTWLSCPHDLPAVREVVTQRRLVWKEARRG